MCKFVFIGAVLAILTTASPAQRSSNPPDSPPGAQAPMTLELSKPIERELRGGKSHWYKIHAEEGQFVHVVVLQKGIDVVVTLLDPAGRTVAKMDSLNGAYGPEPVSAIAEVSGEFRLNVAVLSKDATAGRYEAQLTDLHPPAPSDRTRMEAERVYMEGLELYVRGDTESWKAASGKWQLSLTHWQSLHDKYGQALSLLSAGAAYDALGEMQKALEGKGNSHPANLSAKFPNPLNRLFSVYS